MRLTILVKLHSKFEDVQLLSDQTYVVRVKAKPIDGAANSRVIELLAQYLKCPKSHLQIIKGLTSRQKVIQRLTS